MSPSQCPLYPSKRTSRPRLEMSALCHLRLNAPQQTAALFDHLVGAGEQRRRHVERDSRNGEVSATPWL